MLRLNVRAHPLCGSLIWIYLLNHEMILYIQSVYPYYHAQYTISFIIFFNKESVTLLVQPMHGAVVRKNDYFHCPHEYILDSFPRQGKQLKLFQTILLIIIIHNDQIKPYRFPLSFTKKTLGVIINLC